MSVSRRADRVSGTGRRRASNPARVVVTGGIIGGALLLAGSVIASSVATRTVRRAQISEVASAATPVLSARRAPATLSLITRTGRVERALSAVSSMVPTGSCAVVKWKGETMVDRGADAPVIPASSIKIITGTAALAVLGRDFRFETSVQGTVDGLGNVGDLYLVGGGDPVLLRGEYPATQKYPTNGGTRLEVLADAVRDAGVRAVTGAIIGVDTRYDAERWIPSWSPSLRGIEGGPLGALMVNDGAVVGEKSKRDDPALAAAVEFGNLLVARGITTSGIARHDVLPSGTSKIASAQSAPLAEIVRDMLINSDNNTAELLLKEMGLVKKGAGTTQNGIAVVTEFLQSKGAASGVTMVDGSGLSSANRVPCSVLMSLLDQQKDFLPTSLAVAGVSGTLRAAFEGQSVRGRLVGKTGTLTGVKALVGYVPVEGDEPVEFALLLNAPGIDEQIRHRPIWYAFGAAMGKARGAPTADQLAP